MFKHEFDQIMREHFDLSDKYTRRYIASLSEDAQQDQLLAALSSALYNKVVEKVDDIDFGTIPLSRGDITKVQGFSSTEECLNIIRRLVIEYKQNPAVVDVVISAVNNIKERKALFIKGYTLNVELPMLLYNTMVLAVERSTSLMIATCIEYVKDTTGNDFKMALDKAAYNRTMDDLLFKQLIDFNNMCHKGQLDKTLEAVMKNPVRVKEEVENMYGSVRAIDEEDPTSPEMPTISDDDSPFDNQDTVEPAENQEENEPAQELPVPFEVPSEPPVDPAEEESPEDKDVNPDTQLTFGDQHDEVEPENIPTVNPGDDVLSSDTPLNELDDTDENNETNNGVPYIPEEEEPVEESAAATAAVIKAVAIGGAALAAYLTPKVIMLIIRLIRSCIYTYYHSKMKISDYLEIQADLIEANANDLQYSTTSDVPDKEKEKIIKKQLKIAAKLRKWSNKFAIDSKASSNKAKQEIDKEDKSKNKIQPNENGDDSIF